MYSGAESDIPTAIIDSMDSASSSPSQNWSGSTVIEPSSSEYTRRILVREERETNTLILGGHALAMLLSSPRKAASHGRELEPPSPKWSTRPLKVLYETPIASQPETSMFSSKTETVCDLPEPWTPQTMTENGAFY